MALFTCKMCGGTLDVQADATVATCEYCGMHQTLPKLDSEKRAKLYDRANHFRRNNEFDKAMDIFEQILNEDNHDAEAYWSLVLCRYGIEYVEDPSSHKKIPTVNRAQFTSIFDDDNYKSALQNADLYQRAIYEEEARAINEIQKGILAISQREMPFDVFICYKETDKNGRRTPDSVLANELYHQLTQEGFHVFFSRITLEDKLGTAYEPYIFAALNSAKVMVVLGTKPEYFNAVWVKNEWSRFLALTKNGTQKVLIPAYRDMDPYHLPEEFSHLQAQDMSKLGFMQDLIRGIKKLTSGSNPKYIKEQPAQSNANTDPLLRRVFLFLEDADWQSADEYCEKVLDIDPECAEAYLGKMMAELKIHRRENLADQAEPFDQDAFYNKAIRFGDDDLVKELKGYINTIRQRNEHTRLMGIYQSGLRLLSSAKTEADYSAAAEIFASVSGFEDADEKVKECKQKANETLFGGLYAAALALLHSAKTEEDFIKAGKAFDAIKEYKDAEKLSAACMEQASAAKNDAIYTGAVALMAGNKVKNYQSAIAEFKKIPDWKDSAEKIELCTKKIESINASLAALTLEKENRRAARKEAMTRRLPVIKKIGMIVAAILVVALLIKLLYPLFGQDTPAPQDQISGTQGTFSEQTFDITGPVADPTVGTVTDPTTDAGITTPTEPPTEPETTDPKPTEPGTPDPKPTEPKPPQSTKPTNPTNPTNPADPIPPAGDATHANNCPFANGAHADAMKEEGELAWCYVGSDYVQHNSWGQGSEGYCELRISYTLGARMISKGEYYYPNNTLEHFSKTIDIYFHENGAVSDWIWCDYYSSGEQKSLIWKNYDSAGNLDNEIREEMNSSGNTIRHEQIEADGSKVVQEYNNAGVPIKCTTYFSNGKVYEIEEFDSNGYPKKFIRYNEDGSVSDSSTYECDSRGNITKWVDYNSDGSIYMWLVYSHDSNDRLIKTSVYNSDGSLSHIYEYDNQGRDKKITVYNRDGSINYWYTLDYNASGQCIKHTEYKGANRLYCVIEYDHNTNMAKGTYYKEDGSVDFVSEYPMLEN